MLLYTLEYDTEIFDLYALAGSHKVGRVKLCMLTVVTSINLIARVLRYAAR